jgi:cell division protein FtsB
MTLAGYVLKKHLGRVDWSIAVRRIAIMLIGLVVAGTAVGEDAKPVSRFAVQPSDDGFVRLDTRTGTVSHCGRRNGVWFCEKLVEDQTALEQEIDALRARIDTLSRQIETLATRVPAANAPPAQDQTATEHEIDGLRARMDTLSKQVETLAARPAASPPAVESPGFVTKLMHRLYALVRRIKGEAGS